ncbi:MAG: hypothetical protein FJ137_14425 [Deltaproteobacteria bacterium]|nr:hypothetical protein [Deltaproteobacteria bacterium]
MDDVDEFDAQADVNHAARGVVRYAQAQDVRARVERIEQHRVTRRPAARSCGQGLGAVVVRIEGNDTGCQGQHRPQRRARGDVKRRAADVPGGIQIGGGLEGKRDHQRRAAPARYFSLALSLSLSFALAPAIVSRRAAHDTDSEHQGTEPNRHV